MNDTTALWNQLSMYLIQPSTLLKMMAKPLHFIPTKIHYFVSAKVLNHLFKQELSEGELDFLEGQLLLIQIRDIAFEMAFYLQNNQFIEPPRYLSPNMVMNGDTKDFLALINQQEDPDTLFFQRRLRLSGNTELSLHLKNFLDAIEWEHHYLPLPIRNILIKIENSLKNQDEIRTI